MNHQKIIKNLVVLRIQIKLILLLLLFLSTGCKTVDLSDYDGVWRATHLTINGNSVIKNDSIISPFDTKVSSRLKTTISDQTSSISVHLGEDIWYDFKVTNKTKNKIKLESLQSDELNGVYQISLDEFISKPHGFNNKVNCQILKFKNDISYVVFTRCLTLKPKKVF